MPWKECHVIDERLRFVARLLEGESMTALCEEFGISRKTGYKIYERYRADGLQGLADRSRRPQRQANQLPVSIEGQIVRLRRKYPSWGAPKIREKLRPLCAPVRCPAISTVHAVLHRHNLVRASRSPTTARRRHAADAGDDAPCAVVRRFQRTVSARGSPLLLSAHDLGLRQSFRGALRGPRDHARDHRRTGV